MARPKKIEISHWDRKYYTLDPKRDKQALDKAREEKLMRAFEYVHLMAFDKPIAYGKLMDTRRLVAAIIKEL